MTLSERFARHLAGLRYEALPQAALDASKRIMRDTLAVAWAGSEAPGLAELRRGMASAGTESVLWGTGQRTSALDAAFLNGVAAAALDYDALHLDAVVHSDIVLLPSMLAIAEREHETALSVGNGDRAGMAALDDGPSHHLDEDGIGRIGFTHA